MPDTKTAAPRRIQRQRATGWRKPPGAVYVGRGSVWGNPFIVGQTTPTDWHPGFAGIAVTDRAHAVDLLRQYLAWRAERPAGWSSPTGPTYQWESTIRTLQGRDLMCWCPLVGSDGTPVPCHADVLLEIADGEETP
jgi:hypothetical protein